jgi:hypothetical protein
MATKARSAFHTQMQLGMNRISSRDWRGAFDAYAALVESDAVPREERWALYNNLAIVAYAVPVADMERVYAVACARDGDIVSVWFGRGKARNKAGAHEGAVEDLERVVSMEQAHPDARTLLVESLSALGRVDDARAHEIWLDRHDPARRRERKTAAGKRKLQGGDKLSIVAAVLRAAPKRARSLEGRGDVTSFMNDLKRLADSIDTGGELALPHWFLEDDD